MLILAVETSCDETAAAVLADGKRIVSDVVNSQIAIHGQYGGVVPELASRHHMQNILPVVESALSQASITLDDLDGLAVTQGPGLIGSLLVGVSLVKSISFVKKIPYVGVDHMAGHLNSIFLADEHPDFPHVALVASGGHSSIYLVEAPTRFRLLGRTLDDAAGEAFDKAAKLTGLPYPGGPAINRLAVVGNRAAIAFPRSWLDSERFDFSFSGVKTALANFMRNKTDKELPPLADICASFQEAIVEVLVEKTIKAAKAFGIRDIAAAGGVSANSRLRDLLVERAAAEGLRAYLPPLSFCTDNAAMVALAGYHLFSQDLGTLSLDMDVYSRSLA